MTKVVTRKSFFFIALLAALLMLLLSCTESASAAACKKAQLNPKIDPSKCRPSPKMKKAACTKLIAKCRCQHNIIMKWVPGGGCPKKTPAGTSGCQCASFCDLSCAGKCKKDKSGQCGWFAAEGKCKNRHTLETGPVPQCQAPTSSPTEATASFPDTPGPSIEVFAPTVSPTTTSKPSLTPSTSPTTSRPSASPSKSPTTSKPTSSPSKSPTTSTPTTSKPTTSPSKSPTTSKPTTSPSKSPTTSKPTASPSKSPTTSKPTSSPSKSPTTSKPTSSPSKSPTTSKPTTSPSKSPTTSKPTASPSKSPTTSKPTTSPSKSPTTSKPTASPSKSPTTSKPTSSPSKSPTTSKPTASPSKSPTTSKPTSSPSKSPTTSKPTSSPSKSPTTSKPTTSPSKSPTTSKPTASPSKSPTTSKPTSSPSKSPTTSKPTASPSKSPTTSKPTSSPSKSPTTSKPTSSPSKSPTTSKPTGSPTTSRPSASPAVCLNSLPADRIACGEEHSCAINKNNAGKCWGQQSQGRLGNNDRDYEERDRAVSVYNFNSGWKIYTGDEHSCAITTSKSVYCWGNNDDSQLGNDGDDSKIPIKIGLGSGETAENMCLGAYHTCAVTSSGKVLCWGKNNKKQCGQPSAIDVVSPTQVGANLHSVFVQVACADESTCALTNEGKVYCWGDNGRGQLGRGTGSGSDHTPHLVSSLDSVTSVGAGAQHFCARVTCEAKLKCWGRNDEGQVGNGQTSDKVTSPVNAHPSYSGIVSFAASEKVTCIVLENGRAYCWGVKSRRGDGSHNDSVNPTQVGGGITTAVEVACGQDHCCIRHQDQSVKCFGEGSDGQLGNGNDDDENTPVTVQNLD